MGTYTLANAGLPGDGCARNVTVKRTAAGAADTIEVGFGTVVGLPAMAVVGTRTGPRSRAEVERKSRLRSISSAISAHGSTDVQAAASSIPSGMPSTR